MSLADKTRLRILNLMREGEVCVCFFTEVLEISQPKVSRHLAYLRTANVVRTRREGKWMHYSINWPENDEARTVVNSVLEWLGSLEELQAEHNRYMKLMYSPEMRGQIAKTRMQFLDLESRSPEPESQPMHNELEEYLL